MSLEKDNITKIPLFLSPLLTYVQLHKEIMALLKKVAHGILVISHVLVAEIILYFF